jgi:hypothetical protein
MCPFLLGRTAYRCFRAWKITLASQFVGAVRLVGVGPKNLEAVKAAAAVMTVPARWHNLEDHAVVIGNRITLNLLLPNQEVLHWRIS